jgi:hypothetical protein
MRILPGMPRQRAVGADMDRSGLAGIEGLDQGGIARGTARRDIAEHGRYAGQPPFGNRKGADQGQRIVHAAIGIDPDPHPVSPCRRSHPLAKHCELAEYAAGPSRGRPVCHSFS